MHELNFARKCKALYAMHYIIIQNKFYYIASIKKYYGMQLLLVKLSCYRDSRQGASRASRSANDVRDVKSGVPTQNKSK